MCVYLAVYRSYPVRRATVLKMQALFLLLTAASSAANVKQFTQKDDTTTTDSWDTTTNDPWDSSTTYPWDDTTTTHYWDTTTTYPWDSTTTYPWDTTTTSGAACPLGWVNDGNLGCFLFAPQMAGFSWIEALDYCEEQAYTPIIILTEF